MVVHNKLHNLFATTSVRRVTHLCCIAVCLLSAGHSTAAEQTFTDYAKVESVEPIVRRERITEPVQQCRPVRAATPLSRSPYYRERANPPHEVVRSIVGGLIGGAIGSRIGGGRGRQAMTIVGAMSGAAIANRRRRDDQYRDYVYHRRTDAVAERCEQVLRVRDMETITGYRVRYRYQGQPGTRIVTEPPGATVPVTVTLRPLVGQSR